MAMDEAALNELFETAGLLDRGERQAAVQNKPVLGIDIGATSAKFVQMGPNGRILGMDFVQLETGMAQEESDQRIIKALSSMIQRSKTKIRRAVVCVSDKSTQMRTARLPNLKEQFQEALALEINKLLGSRRKEDCVINHIVFEDKRSSDDNKKTVLIFSTDRSAIFRALGIANGAGLKPIAVDIDALAAARFYQNSYKTSQDESTVLAEIRSSDSLLSFVEQGRLIWAKHISTGGQEFTISIGNTLMVDSAQAEILKRGEWKGDVSLHEKKSEVIRALQPILDRLAGEIRRSIQFYLSQGNNRRIDWIVLGGTGSKIPGLDKDLTKLLGLPVIRWAKTSRFNFSSVIPEEKALPEELSRFAVCLGLCLWKKGTDPINLLPGPWERFAPRRTPDKVVMRAIKKPLISLPRLNINKTATLAASLILTVLLGTGTVFYMKGQKLKIQLAEQLRILEERREGFEEMDRLRGLQKMVVEKRKQIHKLRSQLFTVGKPLAKFSTSVPKNISLVSIKFENGSFTVSGYTWNTKTLRNLVRQLKKSEQFTSVELGQIRNSAPMGQRKIYFQLQFGLNRNEV